MVHDKSSCSHRRSPDSVKLSLRRLPRTTNVFRSLRHHLCESTDMFLYVTTKLIAILQSQSWPACVAEAQGGGESPRLLVPRRQRVRIELGCTWLTYSARPCSCPSQSSPSTREPWRRRNARNLHPAVAKQHPWRFPPGPRRSVHEQRDGACAQI